MAQCGSGELPFCISTARLPVGALPRMATFKHGAWRVQCLTPRARSHWQRRQTCGQLTGDVTSPQAHEPRQSFTFYPLLKTRPGQLCVRFCVQRMFAGLFQFVQGARLAELLRKLGRHRHRRRARVRPATSWLAATARQNACLRQAVATPRLRVILAVRNRSRATSVRAGKVTSKITFRIS